MRSPSQKRSVSGLRNLRQEQQHGSSESSDNAPTGGQQLGSIAIDSHLPLLANRLTFC
jgi:hypothetical protein